MRAVLEEIGFTGALLAREDESGNLVLIDGHLRAALGSTPRERVPRLGMARTVPRLRPADRSRPRGTRFQAPQANSSAVRVRLERDVSPGSQVFTAEWGRNQAVRTFPRIHLAAKVELPHAARNAPGVRSQRT